MSGREVIVNQPILQILANMSSSVRDLKNAIKESLTKTGALAEIRAQLRAEIYQMLQEESEPPPPLSNENLLINDLIREYLIYNGYLFTESVLLSESGQPQFQVQRNILEQQLNIKSIRDAENLPILYGLISHLRKSNESDRKEGPSLSSEKK